MWLNKIRKRKVQYLIIMLLLLISSAILVACISFAWETKKFVDEYYDVKKCPIIYTILNKENGKELLDNSSDIQKYVSKVDTGKAKIMKDACYSKGEKLDSEEIILYKVDEIKDLGYKIQFSEGKSRKAPTDDEIWISHIFANAADLEVGDTISFGTDKKTFKISAIVNTPECSSSFLDNYICFMNEKTLSTVNGVDGYAVQIYAKNSDVTVKQIMSAYPEQFASESLYTIERDTLVKCLTMLAVIFGGVGIVAALLIFGVSIIVLRYLVRGTLAKEYRMIGIYKSLGRKSNEIRKIYFTSYLVTGGLGILPGLFLAKPLALYLANTVLGQNKAFHLTYRTVVVMVLSAIAMIILLTFNIWLELRKINKITPIQALAVGTLSSKKKFCSSVIPNAYSATSMAINNGFKNRGMTLLIILILSVSFYVNLMACSVGVTLGNYNNDVSVWENLPKFDGYIDMNKEDSNNVIEYLNQSKEIKDYVALNLSPNCMELEFEGSKFTVNNANPMVYDNFTKDRYRNVPFTKGRICLNPHEIACSEDFLKQSNKSVGDYYKLKAKGNEISFLIVGSYSAKMKGGTSFYILNQDMKELGLELELPTILFFLKDSKDYNSFVKDFEQHFSLAKIEKQFAFINQEGKTIKNISDPICIVIFFAFLAFSLLNLVNLLYTQTRENRKKYGILKALGFTTRYIRREVLIRTTIECVIAIIITVILHEFLSPVIFSLACGVKHICKPLWLTVTICSGMYAIIICITCLMLLPVRKIMPVELMEE